MVDAAAISKKFSLYTLEQVADLFSVKPAELRTLTEATGIFRKIGQKVFFTDEDVTALIAAAGPSAEEEHDEYADSPGVSFYFSGKTPDPATVGYAVVLGDSVDKESPYFIGWASREPGGVNSLLEAVQFGYPGYLSALCWSAATWDEVRQLRDELHGERFGGGSPNWYNPTEAVRSRVQAIREAPLESAEPANDPEN